MHQYKKRVPYAPGIQRTVLYRRTFDLIKYYISNDSECRINSESGLNQNYEIKLKSRMDSDCRINSESKINLKLEKNKLRILNLTFKSQNPDSHFLYIKSKQGGEILSSPMGSDFASQNKEDCMMQKEIHLEALHSFTEKVKGDPNVIALVLSGSLAYGTVWKRSDIDLTMLVRDGTITKFALYNIDEDGVEIHMILMPVGVFKKEMRRFRAGEFTHGYYGKGEIVFSKDASLYTIFEETRQVGMDDAAASMIRKVQYLLVNMYRVEKWITALHDPLYSQHFLQECAASAADILLLMNAEEPTRESILRAMELRPELMHKIHVIPCTTVMTEDNVRNTLKTLDDFIQETMEYWKVPVLSFFSDGEPKTSSEYEHYLGYDVIFCLNYLAEHGLLERITMPSRVFKHSALTVEEIAFVAVI